MTNLLKTEKILQIINNQKRKILCFHLGKMMFGTLKRKSNYSGMGLGFAKILSM